MQNTGRPFFRKKPAATSVPDDYAYPPPKWKFTNITDAQIHRSIKKMKPYKATVVSTGVVVDAAHVNIPSKKKVENEIENSIY